MEEYRARSAAAPPHRRKPSAALDSLLQKNRSHRGYDTGFAVREDQLRTIIGVNAKIPSARNQQKSEAKGP